MSKLKYITLTNSIFLVLKFTYMKESIFACISSLKLEQIF